MIIFVLTFSFFYFYSLLIVLIKHAQQVEKELKIPVLAIVRLKHLVTYVKEAALAATSNSSQSLKGNDDNLLLKIEQYRGQYGVDY